MPRKMRLASEVYNHIRQKCSVANLVWYFLAEYHTNAFPARLSARFCGLGNGKRCSHPLQCHCFDRAQLI